MGERNLVTEDVRKGLWDAEQGIAKLENLKARLVGRCTHRTRGGESVLRYRGAGDLYDHEYWYCDVCGGGQREKP